MDKAKNMDKIRCVEHGCGKVKYVMDMQYDRKRNCLICKEHKISKAK